MEMQRTWDALAAGETSTYVGDPATGVRELESLFGRLGGDPRGGTCVEVGCGPGRMTGALAERFDEVLAVDVSPAMLERARAATGAANVRFLAVPGDRLDGVGDGDADTLVCYLVLQHLPSRDVVRAYLREFARVLAADGEAYVQLPVLSGARGRVWRALRNLVVPLERTPDRSRAFRGTRMTRAEVEEALRDAGLVVTRRDEGPSAYRYASDVFLRLRRG